MTRPAPCPRPRASAAASAPPPPPVPAPLRSTAAALEVVQHCLPTELPAVVALPLDGAHAGRHVWCIERTLRPDDVLTVARMVLGASPDATHLVLASGRPTAKVVPEDDDWWRWSALRSSCEEEGVLLLDWFVIGAADAVSMGELDELPETRWLQR